MNIATLLRLPTLVAVVASLVAATPANARESAAAANDHKFDLAIVDSIPRSGAVAVIVRYADPSRNDAVLIKSAAATPELLYSALGELEASRAAQSSVRATSYEFITAAQPMSTIPQKGIERFQAMLTRVLGRPFTRIGNLGDGRWDTIADPGVRVRKGP